MRRSSYLPIWAPLYVEGAVSRLCAARPSTFLLCRVAAPPCHAAGVGGRSLGREFGRRGAGPAERDLPLGKRAITCPAPTISSDIDKPPS